MNTVFKSVIFILFFLSAEVGFAQSQKSGGSLRATKIGFTTYNYTGPENTSFSEGSSAYGAELTVDAGSEYLRYFFKARFNQASGRQNFIYGTTTYSTPYEFMSIEPEIGLALYPVKRRLSGLNIYLWGVGNVSYNYLNLKTIPAAVTVDPKTQSLAAGYGAGLGFEFVVSTSTSSRSGKRIMLYSEIGFRESTVELAGTKKFSVGGMTAAVGLGF